MRCFIVINLASDKLFSSHSCNYLLDTISCTRTTATDKHELHYKTRQPTVVQ